LGIFICRRKFTENNQVYKSVRTPFQFVTLAMKGQHIAYIKQLQIPKSIERIIGAHKDERGRNDITLRT